MSNLSKLKQGLRAYIKLNGYTWNSFGKKHSMSILKDCLRTETNMSVSEQEKIINDVLEKEGLVLEDLKNATYELAKLEAELKIDKMKEKALLQSRDSKRIKPFLEELETLWSMHPDLRFGQLISSLAAKMDTDSFYAEDDVWLDKIREKINE